MLEILNIHKVMSGQTVLAGIDLQIPDGEFLSLLGPSGCGKTTLLRIIAGLETADGGSITLNQTPMLPVPPQKRPIHMVFQKYALFPHLTVEENLAFGLKLKKVPAADIQTKCRRTLEMVGLQGFAGRKPETLSGGQAQRVAVARALVNEPKVLLLDEPLSALDQKMREHMQGELKSLQRQLGITFIFVTHDQDEAMAMSDRVALMNHGRLEQVGTPVEFLSRPGTDFVKDFVGTTSKVLGTVKSVSGASVRLLLDNGEEIRGIFLGAEKPAEGSRATAFIRSDKIGICGEREVAR